MTYETFEQAVFAAATAAGCDAAELYSLDSSAFSASVLEGALDRYNVSDTLSVGLRVQVNGRDGYACTEALEDPETLVARAAENARLVESGDEQPLQGPCAYPAVETPQGALRDLTEQDKIQLARRMEQAAREADPRFLRVTACTVASGRAVTRLSNTLGLSARREACSDILYIGVLLRDGEDMREGFALRMGALADQAEACARDAVAEAAAQCSAGPVPAGTYRILLRRDAASDLLGSFFSLFSADAAQRGLSPLADRLGQTVASPLVTLVDDPFAPWDPRAFDAEGVPSQVTTVIERGVLKSLLHNLKTAKKAGVSSTGNAARGVGAPVSVGPSNLYIQSGQEDLAALEARLGDGLLITEVSGLHAGVNAVTGEFSLLCKGFLVQGGRRVRPITQCTVGGSFLTLLQQIEAVGCDQLAATVGGGSVSSPSLLITGLMAGGKDE